MSASVRYNLVFCCNKRRWCCCSVNIRNVYWKSEKHIFKSKTHALDKGRSNAVRVLLIRGHCLYKDILSGYWSISPPIHHFPIFCLMHSGQILTAGIKPCFSPCSKAVVVFADSGPVAEKNGALQCVVSVANPHDSLLTIIARGWEGF